MTKGRVKIARAQYRHPALVTGQVITVALPWRRGSLPLVCLPEQGWVALTEDIGFAPLDFQGARESGRRQREHDAATRRLKIKAGEIDLHANHRDRFAAISDDPAVRPLFDANILPTEEGLGRALAHQAGKNETGESRILAKRDAKTEELEHYLAAETSEPGSTPVETSAVRFIRTRLEVSHQERAICEISGPWGIGKTTAVDSFAREKAGSCIVVKVEQGSSRRGASPVSILQQTLEAVRPYVGRTPRASLSNAYWSLRQMLYNYLNDWRSRQGEIAGPDRQPLLSIVFDEGQYLSREAIEMLRYWNDEDRTTTPFPLGLIFVGNSEFALAEDGSGQSVLSGAVRSRALFVESLEYDDVSDDDIVGLLTSRGAYEPDAVSLVLSYFRQRRVRRDLRNVMQLDEVFRRRSQAGPVAPHIVPAVLS